MKRNLFLVVITFTLSLFVFSSCETNNGPEGPKSLTISSDKQTIMDNSGAVFTLKVMGDDQKNYTTTAEYYLNDEAMTGNVFNPAGKSGIYTVYAKVGDIKSNVITLNVIGENFPFASIAISSDKDKVMEQVGRFTFSVKGTISEENIIDLTNLVKIYVNDSPIEGVTYAPVEQGSYSAYAKLGTQTSNVLDLQAVIPISISISSDRDKVPPQIDHFIFTVKGAIPGSGDVDITKSEKVKIYVNNLPIDTTTYIPAEQGTYSVYAKYGTQTSTTITVQAVEAFVHKVLIEDFTGAWCGWCTRVTYGIEQVYKQTNRVVTAAIHRGNAPGASGSVDPWNLSAAPALESAIGLAGYPTAFLNRTSKWAYPENSNVTQPIEMLQNYSFYGISISSALASTGGTIDISISFKDALASAKCVVYILEDDLIYDQQNYNTGASGTPVLYGGASVLKNFVHKDVVRTSVTNILGEAIPAEKSVAGGVYSKSFTSVSYSSENVAKLKVMVVLLDSNGKVVNVQVAPANTSKDYEIVN